MYSFYLKLNQTHLLLVGIYGENIKLEGKWQVDALSPPPVPITATPVFNSVVL